MNKRLVTIKDLPRPTPLAPEHLDDSVPMSHKQVFELIRFMCGGGECPDLLFCKDGVHVRGKLIGEVDDYTQT